MSQNIPDNPIKIGDYEVKSRLGSGSQGTVFLCDDPRARRQVAVKVIDDADGLNAATEAQKLAALGGCDGVPILYHVLPDGKRLCLVAEYVHGETLEQTLSRGPLPPDQAASIAVSVADTLQFVHERNIHHLDVKPANIIIRADGRVVLVDFGVSVSLAEFADGDLSPGDFVGTPPYMAPEFWRGSHVVFDARADIYSLGAVFYHMLTGRPPYGETKAMQTYRDYLTEPAPPGADQHQIIMSIAAEFNALYGVRPEPPPPSQQDHTIHQRLVEICLQAMRVEIEDRFKSAGELADALRRHSSPPRPDPLLNATLANALRGPLRLRRRTVAAVVLAAIFFVLLVAPFLAAFWKRRDLRQAHALADAVLTARAEDVPLALEKLHAFGELAIPQLRDHLDDERVDPLQRLHAAYALSRLGSPPRSHLLGAISALPASECRNMVEALRSITPPPLPELVRRSRSARKADERVRCAILALHLGDATVAEEMLAPRADPADRTLFIRSYPDWHGDLAQVAHVLETTNDSALRSGLCTALAAVPPSTLEAPERAALTSAISRLYVFDADAATHSAAGWALRNWGQELPVIQPTTRANDGRRWFHNRQRMTMLEIPASDFTMGTATDLRFDDERPAHRVSFTRPIYFADREVTIEQFQRFIDDASYPTQEKPHAWEGPKKPYSPTPDCPVQNINWFDAVLYCNWLSLREDRQPCYKRTGEKQRIIDQSQQEQLCDVWQCDFAVEGYRLPTEAEWECACRSGSATDYSFGSDIETLPAYAWFLNNASDRAWPAGRTLPSAWGLYDMHGNVWEWCWDWKGSYANGEAIDPTGPPSGSGRVIRGGGFEATAALCRAVDRTSYPPIYRYGTYGLRPVCGK